MNPNDISIDYRHARSSIFMFLTIGVGIHWQWSLFCMAVVLEFDGVGRNAFPIRHIVPRSFSLVQRSYSDRNEDSLFLGIWKRKVPLLLSGVLHGRCVSDLHHPREMHLTIGNDDTQWIIRRTRTIAMVATRRSVFMGNIVPVTR